MTRKTALFLLCLLFASDAVFSQVRDFWQRAGQPPPGIVTCLAINAEGDIFAGTLNEYVFWSQDGGDHWEARMSGLTDADIFSLAITAAGHLFAGARNRGVFRSTNNGETWERVDSGFSSTTVRALATTPDGDVLAGTDRGLYRSFNDGDTWVEASPSWAVRSLAVNRNGDIFAGTADNGIQRRLADGDTWVRVHETSLLITAMAIAPAGEIYAGIEGDAVVRSPDNGDTWQRFDSGLTTIFVRSLVINASGQIYAGTRSSGVFRARNSVNAWEPLTGGLTGSLNIRTLALNANGRPFAGTNGDGVFRSVDKGLPVFGPKPSPPPHARGEDLEIQISITDDSGILETRLHYRQASTRDFAFIPMAPAGGDSFVGSVPGDSLTSRGLEFYIVATDSFGNIIRYPAAGTRSVQVRVANLIKPEMQPEERYELISVPLQLDNPGPDSVLFDDLGPYDDTQWRLLGPTSDSLFAEYPNVSDMLPGKAFWLIVREPDKRLDTGAGISMRTDTTMTIPLKKGWNVVGNPFNFVLKLSNLQLDSDSASSPELRRYAVDWNDPVNDPVKGMEPFTGYAIHSDERDLLVIDPRTAFSEATSGQNPNAVNAAPEWSIRIVARCRTARDSDNLAAVDRDAQRHRDPQDRPEPPVIGNYVSVNFPHPEWRAVSKKYCTDFRPPFPDSEIWTFEVRTNIRDKIDLTFTGLESVPPEFDVWLVDDHLGIVRNLRPQPHYAVAGAGEAPQQLQLLVGTPEAVAERLSLAHRNPASFVLEQNFPNPFNPVTTIRFSLPQTERVTVTIYNLLGKEVATLLQDEVLTAGPHITIWNGRNDAGRGVASGIYLYRVRAGRTLHTRKMALVR